MDQMIWTTPLRLESQAARKEHNRTLDSAERTVRRRNRMNSNPQASNSYPSSSQLPPTFKPRRRLLSTGDIFDNMRGGPSKAYQRDIRTEKERNAEPAKIACEASRNEARNEASGSARRKDTSTSSSLRGLLRRASIGIKTHQRTVRPSQPHSEETGAESYVSSSQPSTYTSASTWHKLKNAASFTSTAYTIEEKSPNLDKEFEYSSDGPSIHPAYEAPITDSAYSTRFGNEPHPGQPVADQDTALPLPGRGQLPPYIPSKSGGGAAARATAAAQNEVLAQLRRLTMHEHRDSGDSESGVEMGMSNLSPIDSHSPNKRSRTDSEVVTNARRSRCKVEKIDFTAYLPNEISAHIFGLLDALALTKCELVSHRWRNIVSTPAIWRDSLFREKSAAFSLGRRVLPNEGLGLPSDSANQDWKSLYRAKTQVEKNWSTGTFKASYLNGHTDSVYCLQFDEHKLLTGSRDRTIRIWDLHTLHCVAIIGAPSFEFKRGPDNWTTDRAVSPEPGEEATETVTSICTVDPEVYKHATHHDASILCLQYDAEILVTGSSDHTAIIHSMKPPFAPIARLSDHTAAVLDVAFDDKHIVTASKDNKICVYNRHTHILVTTLHGHTAPVNSVQINGSSIVSCSGDFSVKLWNLDSATCIREFEGHKKGLACSQFSADGRYIASAGNDKIIRVWDARTGACLRAMPAHGMLIRSLFWDNVSGRLVSGSYDQDILVWRLDDGNGGAGREGLGEGVRDGEVSGQMVPGERVRCETEWRGWHGSWVLAAKRNWRRMVSAGQDRRVLVCDFGEGVGSVEELESDGIDADGKECKGGKVGRYDGEDGKTVERKRRRTESFEEQDLK